VSAAPQSDNGDSHAYLPDFCAASTVFVVVLIAELVAIVLTLAAYDAAELFLIDLARNSLFVLWIALLSTLVMCLFRARLESAGKTRAFVLSFVVLEVLCLALAEVAYRLSCPGCSPNS
jgi:two-component system sensor histidine kinase AlgZ